MPEFRKAVAKTKIPEGSGLPVALGDTVVAVFNLGGEFFALDDACPHRGGSLGVGGVTDDCRVICPMHGWEFDIRTGRLAMSEGVATHRVKIEGDDIWVEV